MGKLGAWRADVRAALCDRLDRRECMGAGGSCMLGDSAAINTTNSSHKIICKNSKKGLTNGFCFDNICERSEERGISDGSQENG